MDYAFEQKVRERAYEIWMAAGMADGVADEHWLRAEQSVLNEAASPTTHSALERASKVKATADVPAGTASSAKPAKPRAATAKAATARKTQARVN